MIIHESGAIYDFGRIYKFMEQRVTTSHLVDEKNESKFGKKKVVRKLHLA
jgi:hypothetical protein